MKIGALSLQNNVILAPMAGVTDLPFRTVVRGFGCSLAYTEMVSADGLVRSSGKTRRYLDSSPSDRPLGVQLFGSDPGILAEAARIATSEGADLIDLNMGCPVKKVVKSGSGGALLRDPRRAAAILKAMREATPLPLTVKMRSGWNHAQVAALELALAAEDCGVDAVILHPRTVVQGFGGRADWALLAQLKERLRIPLVGSGDVMTPADAERMLSETRCDAVMVGRGALGNPWLVAQIISRQKGFPCPLPSLAQRRETIRHHLELSVAYYGEEVGTRDFRKHMLWYTKGLPGGARFRDIASRLSGFEAATEALEDYFQILEKGLDFVISRSNNPA